MRIPEEWHMGLEAIQALPTGGVVMLVGSVDRGKTTFLTLAARSLTQAGLRVALVDADIGQSEIGPPGTIGVAGVRPTWADDPTTKLTDLKPAALYFVGAFSPGAVALEVVTATAQAVRFATQGKADRVLVDTTGYVFGSSARRLKIAKAQAIAPTLILALQQNGELDDLLTALRSATGATVLSLAVPESVGRKTPALRATRRLTRLAKALETAQEIAVPLAGVSLLGCTLGTGRPIAPEKVRWMAKTLRLPVVRAEEGDGTLAVFVDGTVPRTDLGGLTAPLALEFRTQMVRLLALPTYTDAYIGLHDGNGRLLSVGRFLGYDFARDELHLSAALPATPERIRLIVLGRVRLAADGQQQGELRPTEI